MQHYHELLMSKKGDRFEVLSIKGVIDIIGMIIAWIYLVVCYHYL